MSEEVRVCFYCEENILVDPDKCPENPRWVCNDCFKKMKDLYGDYEESDENE